MSGDVTAAASGWLARRNPALSRFDPTPAPGLCPRGGTSSAGRESGPSRHLDGRGRSVKWGKERYAQDADYRERECARRRAFYHAHKQEIAASRLNRHLKSCYGMSRADYDALLESQGGVCAICAKPSKKTLCVDHCHSTGTIRGLLCRKCNLGLGCLADDQAALIAALAYLGHRASGRGQFGSAGQCALSARAALFPGPARTVVLREAHVPIRFGTAPHARGIGERTPTQRPGPCVPDAVQRAAAQISSRNLRKLDCAAERCTADPGPPRTVTVPGLQRSTSHCAAPGTRGARSTSNKGDDMIDDNACPPDGSTTTSPMREALDAELRRESDDGDGQTADILRLIARKLAAKALDGDLGAIREIFDRMDGKSVAGTAADEPPGKVIFQWKEPA
jgi:hypothetical protein